MKRLFIYASIFAAALAVVIISCSRSKNSVNPAVTSPANTANLSRMSVEGPFSQFIPVDSANKMISSYIASVNGQANDSDLRSITFSADSLRKILANGNVSNIKIIFAHTLKYINNGGGGLNCGYQTGELTLIIAGYDSLGNYQYNPANKVLETGKPCPTSCGEGIASLPLLQ